MRVKRICSRCGTAVYRKGGEVHGFLYWEIEAEELHDPIRCLEKQLAAMTKERDKLLYEASPPTTMRCERCGRDVDTACADCAGAELRAENARLRDVVKQIRAISCGEDQVADGDAVFALAVIFHLCRAALAEQDQH